MINMQSLKEQLDNLVNMTITDKLACIHDLYQNYEISEEEEEELYKYVDPYDDCNDVFEYWNDMDYENPLKVEVMA